MAEESTALREAAEQAERDGEGTSRETLGTRLSSLVRRMEHDVEEFKDIMAEMGIDQDTEHGMSHEERQGRQTARAGIRGRRNKDGSPDRRLKENRSGPTGQGEVKDPAHDHRLKANR